MKHKYLIVYKWQFAYDIFNYYYDGKLNIDLLKIEREIRNKHDEYDENLVYLNIINLD